MRMVEANLYPVIPYLHVQQHDREVTSMSDYTHTDLHEKNSAEQRTIESRLIFCACYPVFLSAAVVKRLMPWRNTAALARSGARETIFREASTAASILVGSAFMGL
jgi:hypothetical protein